MGMLINGEWSDEDRTIRDGAYVRPKSKFSSAVSTQTLEEMSQQPGRFHLIASLSCPWSHRVVMTLRLKSLGRLIRMHTAHGPRTEGYRVGMPDNPWPVPGSDHSIIHLHQLYSAADTDYTGRVTVPVLWDAQERTIVSNESARIVEAFDLVDHGPPRWTLRPTDQSAEIETLNHRIDRNLSNAVYRAGKAQSQDAYETAVAEVFETLESLEERLSDSRFLHGNTLTESDIRLWPTLVRFDSVYHGHFKCSRNRLSDYPALWGYARDLMTWPGLADTVDDRAIREAYYGEDTDLNPYGIVAIAPRIDWTATDARKQLGAACVARRCGERIPAVALREHGEDV